MSRIANHSGLYLGIVDWAGQTFDEILTRKNSTLHSQGHRIWRQLEVYRLSSQRLLSHVTTLRVLTFDPNSFSDSVP